MVVRTLSAVKLVLEYLIGLLVNQADWLTSVNPTTLLFEVLSNLELCDPSRFVVTVSPSEFPFYVTEKNSFIKISFFYIDRKSNFIEISFFQIKVMLLCHNHVFSILPISF